MDTTTLLMIALFVALGYFMLVRPARVQQKKQKELLAELEPGARVTTQIGVYGTLIELGEVQARVEVSPGVIITVDKRLVSGVAPRSRDEFWTYPEEPAEEQTEEQAELPATDSTEERDADLDVRTDGTDDRKA